ncbi:acyl carrier protein [Priestia koreensis]|uniref:acyl carrier protein n=1 Tax=Priestia koreensis TaxID=284581 RepID=UPI003D05C794
MNTYFERIQKTLVEASEGTITNEMIKEAGDEIASLGLNSLTFLRWVVLLEEEFDIEFDMEKVFLEESIIWSFRSLENHVSKQVANS